jgi:hypothetical protein
MEEKLRCVTGREWPWQVRGTTFAIIYQRNLNLILLGALTRSHGEERGEKFWSGTGQQQSLDQQDF